ncbi:MAG: hypothetical protein OEM15_12220 [Myxococcales bacterium]|nr:hypothetical protein [Myxococcales bacterium]
MKTILLSSLSTLWLGAAVLVSGCLSADQIELVIISTEPIAGAPSPQTLRVRIFDAATGEQVVAQTADSADGPLAGLNALREGAAYVLALEALFGAGTCADDRAVGISTPFIHQRESYAIPIQVGCADEFGRTLSQPNVARLAAGLETAADGTAVLAGGVPRVELRADAFLVADVVEVIERYDPLAGGFTESGTMVTGRAFPALQAVPEGGVAVFGGVLEGVPQCEATIELIVGSASTAKGSLSQRRCFPDAALLPNAARIVVGGSAVPPALRATDFEAYDVEAEQQTDSGIEGLVFREAPRFVALGNGETMLAIGSVDPEAGGPVVEAVHFGGGCPGGKAPCTFPIPAPGLDQRGLTSTAAAYAECPTGGGTVYVTGGITGGGDGSRTLDQILCVREEENVMDLRLVQAGTLPEPRARHEMVVVRGPSPRLLIVGGGQTPSITNNLLEDALLVPIDPCACVESSPQVLERIPLPFTGSAVLHQLAPLPDGSVLLVGGARIFTDGEGPPRYEALGEAALFVPEIQ